MSQSLLNGAALAARLEQAGGVGMTEGMCSAVPRIRAPLWQSLPQLFQLCSAVQMVTTDIAIIRVSAA
jgi:hypothetical protein